MHHPATENALKAGINRQRGLKEHAEHKILERDQSIFKLIYVSDSEMERDANVWEYVQSHNPYWLGDSDLVGERSVIKNYTNKKGHTSLAHFTTNGKYLKPAGACSVPVSYVGYFKVTRELFRYELVKIERMTEDGILTRYSCEFIPM